MKLWKHTQNRPKQLVEWSGGTMVTALPHFGRFSSPLWTLAGADNTINDLNSDQNWAHECWEFKSKDCLNTSSASSKATREDWDETGALKENEEDVEEEEDDDEEEQSDEGTLEDNSNSRTKEFDFEVWKSCWQKLGMTIHFPEFTWLIEKCSKRLLKWISSTLHPSGGINISMMTFNKLRVDASDPLALLLEALLASPDSGTECASCALMRSNKIQIISR